MPCLLQHAPNAGAPLTQRARHAAPGGSVIGLCLRARRTRQRAPPCRSSSDSGAGAGTGAPPAAPAATTATPATPAAAPAKAVYAGMFGPWSIEPADEFEVWSYRAGLTATVAAFVGVAAFVRLADGSSSAGVLDALSVLGFAGLGLSLVQIHIYVDPLKRTLQALWLLGAAGAAYLALSHPEQPLPLLVATEPWTVWLVGPAAAAMTGVAVKEGICYGKPEAAGLALLLPLLCLSHLAGGAVPQQVEAALLAAVCGVGGVFAGRKYSQAVKDDIGDKSVFEFRKLPEEEQQRILARMQAGGGE